jgi:hypothetical protein
MPIEKCCLDKKKFSASPVTYVGLQMQPRSANHSEENYFSDLLIYIMDFAIKINGIVASLTISLSESCRQMAARAPPWSTEGTSLSSASA